MKKAHGGHQDDFQALPPPLPGPALHFLGVADYVHKKTPDLILWGVATLRVSVRR